MAWDRRRVKALYLKRLKEKIYYEYEIKIVLEADQCCDQCKELHGREMTVEEAIAEQPLPYSKCTRYGYGCCICFYATVGKRDARGRLIPKK